MSQSSQFGREFKQVNQEINVSTNVLEDILSAQAMFNESIGNPMRGPELRPADGDRRWYANVQPDHAIKENMVALIREACEVLDEINSKPWKKARELNRFSLKMELVDVFQFWLNAVNEAGFTPNEMIEAFYDKLQVCYQRHKETSHEKKA